MDIETSKIVCVQAMKALCVCAEVQLHAFLDLRCKCCCVVNLTHPSGKQLLKHTEKEVGWVPKPVWGFSLAPSRNRTSESTLKNSVFASQKVHCASITKLLVLFREIIGIYYENSREYIITICE